MPDLLPLTDLSQLSVTDLRAELPHGLTLTAEVLTRLGRSLGGARAPWEKTSPTCATVLLGPSP